MNKKRLERLLALTMTGAMLVAAAAPAMAEEEYEVLTDADGNVYDLGGMEILIRDWWSPQDGAVSDPTDQYGEDLLDYHDWLEETYNFTLKQVSVEGSDWGSVPEDFLNYVSTDGDDNNYVWVLRTGAEFVSAMNSGLMYDLSTLDCLDFSEPKWVSGVHNLCSKDGAIYACSPLIPEPRGGLYFNKRLLEEAGIDPNLPYELQESGEWTWEKFEELCATITADTDNDGVIDRWALVTDDSETKNEAVFSNNTEYIGLQDGKYVNLTSSDATLEALNWALDMMDKYKFMPEGAEWDYWKTSFPNGEGAFLVGQAYLSANELKDMEDDFGFVCFPKGPNATDYTNCYTDNPYAIPACYDADKAWKIAFAMNLWTDRVPGYEDYNDRLSGYYATFRDAESVDLTIARMCENGMVTYHDMIPGLEFGPQYLWGINLDNPPAQAAETIANEWASYLAAANGEA
ncbi:MAG: extracellular solute-binding protein [Clostridiales bacterium]|nr:extracellular solute-binding protein [Candidatus Blautia equi]